MADFLSAHSAGAKSLVYHTAPTFVEYLETTPQRELLVERLREIRLPPHDQAYVVRYPYVVHLLTVVAEDSPATIAVLPVLARLVAMCPRLDLRVLAREAAAGPLAVLLGDRAATAHLPAGLEHAHLPLLLAFDQTWQCHGSWGPHPQAIASYLAEWQARNPGSHPVGYPSVSDSDIKPPAAQDDPHGNTPDAGPETRQWEPPVQELRLWYNSGLNRACAQEICALLARIQAVLGEADQPQAQQPGSAVDA